MKIQGNLLKMSALYSSPIQYKIFLGGKEIDLNSLIGKPIRIQYLHQINCIRCGRVTQKSFAQGYCYPCFQTAPETEECVLRPELCQAHEGIARDFAYAETHCLIDHYVYLSFTSNVKVGVTRHTQIPTRWIDQGALQAIKVAKTPNRYLAGCIEVDLKAHFADKTNWRQMLSNDNVSVSLSEIKEEAAGLLDPEYHKFLVKDSAPVPLEYPGSTADLPALRSISLDKDPVVQGQLVAIKGQYLIFEDGAALNVRKHDGYLIELSKEF